MIDAESQEIQEFLARWHEAGRAEFESLQHTNLNYDSYYPKTAKTRKRFIACDQGNDNNRSGVYLVDRSTQVIYSIKAYGVPNRQVGRLVEMFAAVRAVEGSAA